MTRPLSHPTETTTAAPVYPADLQVVPPGRLHRVILHCDQRLDPQATHLLREAADKGKGSDKNNRFGTRLPLTTWQVSLRGRLRLFVKDPGRLNEAIEEFGRFCTEELRLTLNLTFLGTAEIEVGYPVSGSVEKYSKCRVFIELQGYRAKVFFDSSPGDWELEVHAKGRGPVDAVERFTTMVVANATFADYLENELPAKVADEVMKLLRAKGGTGIKA